MAVRLSYVVARGNVYGAMPREERRRARVRITLKSAPELYDSPGPYFTTFILHRVAANLGCWRASCGRLDFSSPPRLILFQRGCSGSEDSEISVVNFCRVKRSQRISCRSGVVVTIVIISRKLNAAVVFVNLTGN